MTKPNLNHSLVLATMLGLCSGASAGTASVAGAGKAPAGKGCATCCTPPASPWNVSMASGLSLAKGNSDTLGLGAQFLATYVTPEEEFTFSTDYFYGESDSVVNQNRLVIGAGYNRNLTPDIYLGLGSSFRYDEISLVDYRIGLGPVLGYRLLNTDSTELAVEAGIGYVFEKIDGVKDDYVAFNAAEHFTHTLASGAKIGQNIAFSSELNDFNNFLLTADLSLEVPFSAHWAFKSTAGVTYDNTPAAGQDDTDVFVLAGLSYSAAGFAPPPPTTRRTLFTKRAAAAAPTTGWSNIASAGFGLTSGNSDTLLGTASYDATYRDSDHEILASLGGAYGEVDNNVTQQNAHVSGQYNKVINDTLFAGATAGFLHDDVGGIDYRVTTAAVLGAYLVKNDTAKVSIEAGPGYVWEETSSGTDAYFSLYAAQKASLALSSSVALGESVVYTPEAADFGSYNLSASLFVDFYFADHMALRAAVTDSYDSTPAKGRDENDLLLTTGIAIQF